MTTPNLPGTGITWTDALPRTGLGLTLWAGFVEGELMYRITQEKDRVGPRYQVSMLTISPPFHGYMELRHGPLRSLDSAKKVAENHEANLVGEKTQVDPDDPDAGCPICDTPLGGHDVAACEREEKEMRKFGGTNED